MTRLTPQRQSSGIASVLPKSLVPCLAPRLTDLDLGHNPLHSWGDVVALLGAFPCLTFLNVSHCPLRVWPLTRAPEPAEAEADPAVHCTSLRTLVLNGTGATWADVNRVLVHTPHLLELCLDANNLSCVQLDTTLPCAASLQTLRLEGNDIRVC